MSETQYVDPNSGAAPQPGGFAVAAPVAVDASNEPAEAEPTVSEPDAGADGADSTEPAVEESDSSPEPEGAKDYSDLLSGSIGDVEAYVADHPEERDAIIEAEQQGKARKGVLEL